MIRVLQAYVSVIDPVNRMIGRIVMYGIFVMMGILLWSSVTKVFFLPSLWTLEMAQFAMVAYYILGGPYSIQMGSNVRMDLIYGEMSDRRKAGIDAMTVVFLLIYLGFLLYGGIASTAYSFGYFGSEPIGFFAGPRHGKRRNRLYGAQPNCMATLPVAHQDHHGDRHFPDAAASAVRTGQGHPAP